MNNGGCLQLFIIACLTYIIHGCDPSNIEKTECEISLNPESVVAMTSNDTIHIMCGLNYFDLEYNFHLIFNDDINSDHIDDKTKTMLNEQGIYWECSKVLCNVSIAANTKNNNFTVQCSIFECCTQIAVINIVDGIPNVPDPPKVNSINATSLNISWTSPWVYPVDNYTLRIIANNSESIAFTTFDTDYVFNKPDDFDCEVYEFTVSAITRIGETGFSNPSMNSFPIDIDDVYDDEELLIKSIVRHDGCGDIPTYEIIGNENMNVCPHEMLQYDYQLSDTNIITIIPIRSTPVLFIKQRNGFVLDELEITEIIINEFNQTANISGFINFSSDDITTTYSGKSDLIHPSTIVALINTTVNLTCSANNDSYSAETVIVNGILMNSEKLNDSGITVESIDTQQYNIMITANVDTNGTVIQCFISPCITDEAKLIVVKSQPSAVSPLLAIYNETMVNISWSSPWPHPVNNYIVMIRTLDRTFNYSVFSTVYIYNGSECEQIFVTVQAVTDIGVTQRPNENNITFYKGLKNLDIINTSKEYNFYKGNSSNSPILEVSFNPPITCVNEVLNYLFLLRNLKLDETLTMKTVNSSTVQFKLSNNFLRDDTLLIAVSVNITNGLDTASISLFDNISIVVTSLLPNGETSTTSPAVIGIVAAGFIIIIAIVLGFSIILSYCCYQKIKKNKRARIFRSDGTRNVTADTLNFTLPPMVINTQYSTADEVLYETINEMTLYPTYSTISDSDVPMLPPPRHSSSTGKSEYLNGGPELTTKFTSKDDDYAQMNGKNDAVQSPRYVPAPTINKINSEDESTAFNFENPDKSGE